MRRSYKFLLRPTSKQTDSLTAMLNDHRDLYNAALEEWRGAWAKRRSSVGFESQSIQLPTIRATDPNQKRWGSGSQQATLRRLHQTIASFFRRIKAGERAGYPRFKGAGQFDTVVWPRLNDACRWDSSSTTGQLRVYLQGIGHIRVHAHRPVLGRIKTISVKRQHGRWFVILSCDDVPRVLAPPTGRSVGIDLGVTALLTTSNGDRIENPRFGAAVARRLANVHRAISRSKKGSRRRARLGSHVGQIVGKGGRQRRDRAYKMAASLVREYDFIAHEDLRIASLTRSASGTVDAPGTNVAGKRGLNRSIHDAGWRVLLSILAAKAESAGRMLIAVNPRNTSRRCHKCGYVAAGNRVTQAAFRCLSCGHEDHADINAAKNILRAGLALREAAA